MPLVIRYGWTRGHPPPQCRGNTEATELYNPLFIGTLEKHPRFSLHCYTNPDLCGKLCIKRSVLSHIKSENTRLGRDRCALWKTREATLWFVFTLSYLP